MSFTRIVNFYISKILPYVVILLFLFQIFGNFYFFKDIQQTNNNIYYKIINFLYFIFCILAIISFIMTYITEPGFVTEKNNEFFLYLYKKTRKYSLKRADIFNENHKNKIIHFDDDNDDLYSDGESSDDEMKFKESDYLNNLYNKCKNFSNGLDFNVKKCRQCHIVKVCGTIHCSICHKCVYMKDHHCIWFNQCIGQFNLKYFILFCFYLFLCSFISFQKTVNCIIIKNNFILFYRFNFNKIVLIFTFSILDLTSIIFSAKLLYDQYTNLNDFAIMYDFKRKKTIEIRTKYEILCEDFGDEFCIRWFLPFKAGGFYDVKKMMGEYFEKKANLSGDNRSKNNINKFKTD